MGKAGGFLEYPRVAPGHRAVEERTHDYRELVIPLSDDELRQQAARCMGCGVPFCHSLGCPLNNVIPNWTDLVYRNRWQEAYQQLELTNNFPELTGRLCPASCESACALAVNSSAVTINHIERSIAERAFASGWVLPHPPARESGKRVAIIGSGPSGLAAAQQLRRLGHAVVVFEKADKVGGLLRYGIPDFKLEKWVLDRRIDQMKAEGILFETNTCAGDDISAQEIRRTFDSVILSMGAGKPRDLNVPGRSLKGIHFAMEYLTQSNRFVAGLCKPEEMIWAEGKNVLVIGGGDTGSDCVGTAIRQGARKVYLYEILPKPEVWENPSNPQWPDWPKTLRTTSSHEEGCERDWSIATKEFGGKEGSVTQARFTRVAWKEVPGKPQPEMEEVSGSGFYLDVDLVLLATGFVHVEHDSLLTELGVAFDPRGNIGTDNHATSVPGVFAAGDAMSGPSLVVRSIRNGREAARACHGYLSGSDGVRGAA